MKVDLAVRGRLLTPDGLRRGTLLVSGGRIAALAGPGEEPYGIPLIETGDRIVLPGIVETHVHVNEPGRTSWEGFATATRAAAAGGVTAIVDMPLNSIPPTTTLAGLKAKAAAAEGACWVDYGFWGGVVPGNAAELEPMIDAGAAGFKCFLIDSGVPEFPMAAEADLREAMPILARRGVPLLVHAELSCVPAPAPKDNRGYAGYLASRPRTWENEAIALMVRLCRETGCAVHIVHLSSADALATIAAARAEGLPFTAETCPHYLSFVAEEIADGATHFKCAPPIREAENRERLWAGLADGTLSCVVSDHSPCEPALKVMESGDFHRAWGGISGVQFGLPAVWTGMRERGLGLERLGEWMSAATARLAGLGARKGALVPGHDADFMVFDPDAEFSPAAATIHHRHKVTPYRGRVLRGIVTATYLRGRLVYEKGSFIGKPEGRALAREGAAL
ncbi:MAG: allantoinase AllB [Elusimicrobia bacterium]|nr:allantoinase AllB [Elusimicrobiota bacterium]